MLEITPLQKKVLSLFSKSPLENKFYWTGGTLLSVLYLHHRRSKDLNSLEDIAVNKVMALFDRNDPKDLVDLYFLLKKKNYKVKTLLKWTERKFGVKLGESSFWSECCKGLEDLDEISPLLIAKTFQEKQKIIQEIKEYFNSQSTNYLKKVLK